MRASSENQFIGNIPADWTIKAARNLGVFTGAGVDKKISDDETPVRMINYLDVYRSKNGEVNIYDDLMVTTASIEKIQSVKVNTGDILITPSSETSDDIGHAALIPKVFEDIVYSYHLTRFVPGSQLVPSFATWALNSAPLRGYLSSICTGTTRMVLSREDFKSILIPLPPIEKQKAIVNFLDRETVKIDELIQKQEKLIELIEEKITSVTDGLITKGLDKSVLLKKTKFQTLGEVPRHWDVLQIKRIVSSPVTDGPHETPEFLDEGVPFVSAEAVSKGFIDFKKIRGYISPDANEIYSRKYSPQIHDIYMIKSGATTGVTAIVEDRTDFNIWSPLAVIRCSKRMNPYYVLYAMRSKYFQEMVSLSWSFGTQQNIGMGVIENLYIPVPPKEEQDAIVFSINSILSSLKQLQDKAISAIPLLKEHRSSLISAAVTGKIDVGELV